MSLGVLSSSEPGAVRWIMARTPSGARPEAELLAELGTKLDQIIALLAIQGKNPDDQIRILYDFGYDSTFIGRILGRDPSAVRHAKRTMARKRPTTRNRRARKRS
jgi:hypothetical protein